LEHWPYTNGLKSVPVSNELKETWKNGGRTGKNGEEGGRKGKKGKEGKEGEEGEEGEERKEGEEGEEGKERKEGQEDRNTSPPPPPPPPNNKQQQQPNKRTSVMHTQPLTQPHTPTYPLARLTTQPHATGARGTAVEQIAPHSFAHPGGQTIFFGHDSFVRTSTTDVRHAGHKFHSGGRKQRVQGPCENLESG